MALIVQVDLLAFIREDALIVVILKLQLLQLAHQIAPLPLQLVEHVGELMRSMMVVFDLVL
jgi:hypothetical protein